MINNQIITLAIAALFLLACNQQEVEQLGEKNKQAKKQIEQKDSLLNEMLGAFNQIQENLTAINEREGKMRFRSADDRQDLESYKQAINEDIEGINELMERNKQLIKSLNERLKASKIELSEFNQMIQKLNQQIESKNKEIERLNKILANNKVEMGQLYFMLDSLQFSNQMKEQKIEDQTEKLNTAYYAYGTYKELKEKNVLTKEGGFLGLGKNKELKDNFNKEYFSKIDIREQSSFLIYADKAKLITNHPTGSYEFMGNDGVDSLVIKNPKDFWRASKYCVIVVD
ncbi:MAG: hypothetical protein RIC95_03750 [Vicingaceae bacterium]